MRTFLIALALVFTPVYAEALETAQPLSTLYVWGAEIGSGCLDVPCIRVSASCKAIPPTPYYEELDFVIKDDNGEVFDSAIVDAPGAGPGAGCFPDVGIILTHAIIVERATLNRALQSEAVVEFRLRGLSKVVRRVRVVNSPPPTTPVPALPLLVLPIGALIVLAIAATRGPRLAARMGTHQPDRRIPLAGRADRRVTRNA